MVNREIIISVDEQEKRVAILENGQLDELFLERVGYGNLAGNIYKGRVAQIVKGMEAAFVDIGLNKNGFLYVEEISPAIPEQDEYSVESTDNALRKKKEARPNIENLLRKEQEVLVQVVKEPFGTKGCRLSSQISLPGRFLVLMPFSTNIGISKKIVDEHERENLRNLLRSIGLPRDIGCIIRTQAKGKGKKEFARELKYLLKLWRNIKNNAARKKAPNLIHEEFDLVLRTARDLFNDDITQIVIDHNKDYGRIVNFINALAPHLKRRIKFYREKVPVFEKFGVEKQIEEIFSRQVPLRKGGYLIIERTEALIAVDVNSGSFVNSDRLEETAFLTNLEAAREIARQIRLRDLAGIIVIDFIDMEKAENRKRVLAELEKNMEKDKARLTIYPFSPLGIVQIARQRIRKNIESITYQDCPVCKNRGKIKSTQSIAIKILREIKRFLMVNKKRYLEVYVHPLVAMRLLNEDRAAITNLEKHFWVKIAIFTNEHLGIEEVKFL